MRYAAHAEEFAIKKEENQNESDTFRFSSAQVLWHVTPVAVVQSTSIICVFLRIELSKKTIFIFVNRLGLAYLSDETKNDTRSPESKQKSNEKNQWNWLDGSMVSYSVIETCHDDYDTNIERYL